MKEEANDISLIKDSLLEEMVLKTYKHLRELGEFQSIEEIFGRLPISRIEKDQYQFLFDSVKQNVENLLMTQENMHKLMQKEDNAIKSIALPKAFHASYPFQEQIKTVYSQKLVSSRPIFKSIIYLRNQNQSYFKENYGEENAFLPDQKYINFNEIKYQIGDIKLFLEEAEPIKKYQFEFVDQNIIQFKARNFPDLYQINKRAEVLAKTYLLHLYREQGRKAKQIYKANEAELNKQREIKKIKQELQIQKLKEGEMIEEMDLIKQVYKILMLIEKKMNELAYSQFTKKNGQRATQIKKSLQKLKQVIHEQPSAKAKLKILINYKHKKGW